VPLVWQHLHPSPFLRGNISEGEEEEGEEAAAEEEEEEEAEEEREDLETSTNKYHEQNGAYLLYSSIFIHAHLSKGRGAYGLPARVHDLNNQALPPSLTHKHCAAAICGYLHGMRFAHWQSGFI
jgi:hypothetical protein